jgi:hypothetical protein
MHVCVKINKNKEAKAKYTIGNRIYAVEIV